MFLPRNRVPRRRAAVRRSRAPAVALAPVTKKAEVKLIKSVIKVRVKLNKHLGIVAHL